MISGVHMVSWSSDARFVLAGTPSKVFRVWDTRQRWSHERWNVLQGEEEERKANDPTF